MDDGEVVECEMASSYSRCEGGVEGQGAYLIEKLFLDEKGEAYVLEGNTTLVCRWIGATSVGARHDVHGSLNWACLLACVIIRMRWCL